ncbi:hypothetical protein LOAG_11543 [Loa loa]|uniref:Uncharacterized protein n=1 Tax=Loa loa TaxID=7209 RepID=A0A1S0TMT3_LOALO|nr:hypothetical protein LOAG_11543 [Loa loa]EFO16960.1 hypothetical protein LOAG_11543 [Loa loa]
MYFTKNPIFYHRNEHTNIHTGDKCFSCMWEEFRPVIGEYEKAHGEDSWQCLAQIQLNCMR